VKDGWSFLHRGPDRHGANLLLNRTGTRANGFPACVAAGTLLLA
jgi:hypothetical protein